MTKAKKFFELLNENEVYPELVANVIPSDNKANYDYSNINKPLWKLEGNVYFIVIDGELVKIGRTDKTLNERFNSYKSGTVESRKRGTCSLTNYAISQVFLKALSENKEIEIYGYNTPCIVNTIEILGIKEEITLHTNSKYEQIFMNKFKELFGEYPKYSINNNKLI